MNSIRHLSDIAYRYYPKNISMFSIEYEHSDEFLLLMETLTAARGDSRWDTLKEKLNELSQNKGTDLSYYTLANTCFTLSTVVHLEGFTYHVKVYVGILTGVWSWKAECLFTPDKDPEPAGLSASALQVILKQYAEAELKYKQANPVAFSLQERSFRQYIDQLMKLQTEIFGYDLLTVASEGIILPDIQKNNKSFGTVTLFDCLLTDLKF